MAKEEKEEILGYFQIVLFFPNNENATLRYEPYKMETAKKQYISRKAQDS